MLAWLRRFLFDIFGRLGGKGLPLRTTYVADVPDDPARRRIYLVGENGRQWFVVLRCPCGCGETIQLSLLPTVQPRWTATEEKDGTLTVHPSVWRTKGCRSHFWLRRGLIVWCDGGSRDGGDRLETP